MRTQLANRLAMAAELEHDVMCQYLFAAFSMKRHPKEGGVTGPQIELMRKWQRDLLLIARQEMEHLGIVANLLTAIGEAPRFARPSFPVGAEEFPVPDPLSLEPFGVEVVARLLAFESAGEPNEDEELFLEYLEQETDFPLDEIRRTLGELYREILNLFEQLPEEELFIGPPSAQFGEPSLQPPDPTDAAVSALRRVNLGDDRPPAVYDVHLFVIRDLETATTAIKHVVEEGEGPPRPPETGTDKPPPSHFDRLKMIHEQLLAEHAADPKFRPARNVGPNPRSAPPGGGKPGNGEDRCVTLITHPETLRVSKLFDLAYETTIMMLIRFFAHPVDATNDDRRALQHAVFFPMMTSVIRPLGEILTQLPAKAWEDVRAGPSFVLGRRLAFLPHRDAACLVLHMQLEAMRDRAKELLDFPADSVLAAFRERLGLVYEDAGRMALDFASRTGLTERP